MKKTKKLTKTIKAKKAPSSLKKNFGGIKKHKLDVQPINVFALAIEYPG